MVELNKYLSALPGSKESDNIIETDINKIILNSMPNERRNKACVQGFDCETIDSNKLLVCLNAWKFWR